MHWLADWPADSLLLGEQSRVSILPILTEITYEISDQMPKQWRRVLGWHSPTPPLLQLTPSKSMSNGQLAVISGTPDIQHAARLTVSANYTIHSHFNGIFTLHCFSANLSFSVFPPSFSH